MADNTPFCSPISPGEVLAAVQKIKRGSAPGPDGIGRGALLAWDPKGLKLAGAFNAILYTGKVPKCLKGSVTTLIPKSPDRDKQMDIGQWRPITISSTVLRAFSGILCKRLAEACNTHVRQRGFVESPGCSENLMLLEGMIRLSKREKRALAVVFVDFAKAFDSVSHLHIQAVLAQLGVDQHICELLRSAYHGSHARVKMADGSTDRIYLKKGVKQGDPLSPLLFSLSIDPLLYASEEHGEGFKVRGERVTSFAFADDLVLLSDSWDGMAKNLVILEEFSRLTGLGVNPSKCHSFLISPNGASYRINVGPQWRLGGAPLHLIGIGESVGYLGVCLTPWKGIIKPPLKSMTVDLLTRISAALLKPTQKLAVLKMYALPRLTYAADHRMVGKAVLLERDRLIRSAVKKWLHLSLSTADGLLYARAKDGGLGVVKVAAHIPSVQWRRLTGLQRPACQRGDPGGGLLQRHLEPVLLDRCQGDQYACPGCY